MKREMIRRIFGRVWMAVMAVAAVTALSGCVDIEPYPGSGPGYNRHFYDQALTGCWELVRIDGRYVNPYETNYLEFYGNGRGTYSYYYNGSPRQEPMSYWCNESYSSVSECEINISYYGSPTTSMDYWFGAGADYLYLQWLTSRGPVTYTYAYIRFLPYPFN